MRCLITGACGYVGSWMIPHLLADGHHVVGYDLQWFGDGFLPKDNGQLQLLKADIRDIPTLTKALRGIEAVIHLAGVSNDQSCQLDEALSTSINFEAFEPLVLAAKRAGVRRFIFCSSSSVYGIATAPDVFEDHPVNGLTLYSKYKAACEPILLEHQSEDFACTILRPATVCGYAPRQRFDLTVNMMTMHAVMKREITVYGGSQTRAHLHIKDMTRCYQELLAAPAERIAGQVFNVGCVNQRVRDTAEVVATIVDTMMGGTVRVVIKNNTDNRSYSINSDKIARAIGFEPRHTIERAVRDLCLQFKSGRFKDALTCPLYTNVVQLIEKHGFGAAAGQSQAA